MIHLNTKSLHFRKLRFIRASDIDNGQCELTEQNRRTNNTKSLHFRKLRCLRASDVDNGQCGPTERNRPILFYIWGGGVLFLKHNQEIHHAGSTNKAPTYETMYHDSPDTITYIIVICIL